MPQIQANGIQIHYEISGEGTPIVFVHEFAGDHRSWEDQVRFFNRRYHTLVDNARGIPPTEVPESVSDYSQDIATGDLAEVDTEGFYYIRGRLKRFAKLFGNRISLEDVERDIEMKYDISAAAIEHNGKLQVFATLADGCEPNQVRRHIAEQLGVPPNSIGVESLAEIPRTASGKKDYGALVR